LWRISYDDIGEEFLVTVCRVFFDFDDLWMTLFYTACVDEPTYDPTMSLIRIEEIIFRKDFQVIRSTLGMIRRILMKFNRGASPEWPNTFRRFS
jgi:hypothetical protein